MKSWILLHLVTSDIADRMCMFEVLKSVGKCDKVTDVKYLMKMALQLNQYKSKIGRVASVEDNLYARISHPSDENEEKRATTSSVEIEAKKKKENRETQKMASKSKKQLLKIVPDDKIVFNPPFTSVSSSNISVTNPTENDVIAFKIKTTAPKRYCVRPNVGLLKPGETSDVKFCQTFFIPDTVLLQPGETDEKHKFQVQSLVVPENYDTLSAEEKATAWKSVDNPSMSTRLTCVFVSDRQVPQTIPEEPSSTKETTTEEALYQHEQDLTDGKETSLRNADHIEEIARLKAELKTARDQIESLTSLQNVTTNGERGIDAKALYISIILSFFFGYIISSCYM